MEQAELDGLGNSRLGADRGARNNSGICNYLQAFGL